MSLKCVCSIGNKLLEIIIVRRQIMLTATNYIQVSSLKKGMRISCIIGRYYIPNAYIQVENENLYICQNIIEGSYCNCTHGYKYSFMLSRRRLLTGWYNDEIKDIKVLPYKLNLDKCNICGSEKKATSIICSKCIKAYFTTKCSKCGRITRNYNNRMGGKSYYCYTCYNSLPKCSLCNCVTTPRYKFNNGKLACPECKYDVDEVSYGYFREFAKMKYEKKEENFIGFELELGINSVIYSQYRYLRCNNYMVIKKVGGFFLRIIEKLGLKFKLFASEDCSLVSGIEFQSIPCTYNYLIKKFHLKKLFKHLSKYFKSEDTCGLHFHLSKKTLTAQDIIKIYYFIYNNWRFLVHLSRRTRFNYCRRIDIRVVDKRKDIFPYDTHYSAIRVLNNTVEIRLFKAPNNYEEFMVALQFVNLLRIFVQNNSKTSFIYNDRWDDFKQLAKVYGYKYLLDEINRKGL